VSKKITEELAKKVLKVVNKGLTNGMGEPVPGKMCVEAAVAFAFDEEFSDQPSCVDPSLRDWKIELNDMSGWPSEKARANGLRRVAIAQLGSAVQLGSAQKFILDDFIYDLEEDYLKFLQVHGPKFDTIEDIKGFWCCQFDLSTVNTLVENLEEVVNRRGTHEGSLLPLELAAEFMVRALIKQKIPGTKFLYLAPFPKKLAKYFPDHK
jgi:hypothetical protein